MPWLMTIKRPGDFTTEAIISDLSPGLFVLAQERYREKFNIVFAYEVEEETAKELFEKYGY